jgi:hypothetical protein
MKRPFGMRKAPFFFLIAIPAILLLGLVVMYLWNNVLVNITPVKPVNFWQALGIFVLSKLLFGGFGGGGRGRGWNRDMKEKWNTMAPEEKEKFKQDWKNRCRGWRRPAQTETNIVE